MREYPQVPAAFINAIAEEGTKAEAVDWLQKEWNEKCYLRAELEKIKCHLYAQSALTDKQIIGACRDLAKAALEQ